jgi:hypothetical protein
MKNMGHVLALLIVIFALGSHNAEVNAKDSMGADLPHDPTPGWRLMTWTERRDYRRRMQNLFRTAP